MESVDSALRAIIEALRRPQKVLVTSHSNPDGDAIGATLAMGQILKAMGHQVTCFNADPIPDTYTFLPGAKEWSTRLPADERYEATVILDVFDLPRTGLQAYPLANLGRVMVIDHHIIPEGTRPVGELHYVDSTAAAAGALVYRFAKAAGVKLTLPMALNIYCCVLTDTGSYHYASATPEAFHIGGEMVELGVSPWEFSRHVFESHPAERVRLLAEVLTTLEIDPSGKFASVYVTLEAFTKTGASPEVTDGFINFPRSIAGVEVAMFFRQTGPQAYKISFRSSGHVDVRLICSEFGGGGHRNAAGCNLSGDLAEIKRKIYDACRRELKRGGFL